jgi:CO/xanthine dehydrogenase FAD-binding subunit
MIPEYVKVRSLPELLDRLPEPGATVLCGGTDLLVKMRGGLVSPRLLLDVSDLPDLRGICEADGRVEIGAATTEEEILESDVVRRRFPILVSVLSQLGSVQIRSRGTLGGNLANASPAADSAIPLLLLDAEVVALGKGGERRIPIEAFFQGPGRTALAVGEVVRAISIPFGRSDLVPSFHKIGRRKALIIAIASLGALAAAKGGVLEEVRLAVGSVAPTPLRLRAVEAEVRGKRITPGLVAEARALTARLISPIDDVRASAAYRREVTADLVVRRLEEAARA